MTDLEHPGTLSGKLVTLEPLTREHHDELVVAVQDGELWDLWYTIVPNPAQMSDEIERRLSLWEQGKMLPFVARKNDSGKVIGMTTFMEIDHVTPRVEIGYTWNSKSAQGTGTNPESKLLLMQHAFEVWNCPAVEFRTDFNNHQSRAAILLLGAKQDGVLRQHKRMANGYMRDTVVYSIISPEWPAVKLSLEHRISKHLS